MGHVAEQFDLQGRRPVAGICEDDCDNAGAIHLGEAAAALWYEAGVSSPSAGNVPTMTKSTEPKTKVAQKAQRNRLSSVTTAIRLLKVFSQDEAELGISALAQRLGVAKSTVHRLVVTLVSEGLLEQNPENERYRLGIGLFGLGALVRQRMDLSTEARQHLFALRELTGETILLGIPSDTEIMYIYNLESPQALRMRSDIGVRRPAFCTAVGQAIFAFAPDSIVDRLMARPMTPRTPRTIIDPQQLRATFAEVRSRGFALEDEESEPGIRCIAAPVHGADGLVVGAIGIAGPTQRVSIDALMEFSTPLLQAVDRISVRLGYRAR